jgi:hypothetical protein
MDEFREDTHHMQLTVHWDGKRMGDVSHGSERQDWERLAVCVPGQDMTKILGIPKIGEGTGQQQAQQVVTLLREWSIEDKIVAMGFDTMSSNTGKFDKKSSHLSENSSIFLKSII